MFSSRYTVFDARHAFHEILQLSETLSADLNAGTYNLKQLQVFSFAGMILISYLENNSKQDQAAFLNEMIDKLNGEKLNQLIETLQVLEQVNLPQGQELILPRIVKIKELFEAIRSSVISTLEKQLKKEEAIAKQKEEQAKKQKAKEDAITKQKEEQAKKQKAKEAIAELKEKQNQHKIAAEEKNKNRELRLQTLRKEESQLRKNLINLSVIDDLYKKTFAELQSFGYVPHEAKRFRASSLNLWRNDATNAYNQLVKKLDIADSQVTTHKLFLQGKLKTQPSRGTVEESVLEAEAALATGQAEFNKALTQLTDGLQFTKFVVDKLKENKLLISILKEIDKELAPKSKEAASELRELLVEIALSDPDLNESRNVSVIINGWVETHQQHQAFVDRLEAKFGTFDLIKDKYGFAGEVVSSPSDLLQAQQLADGIVDTLTAIVRSRQEEDRKHGRQYKAEDLVDIAPYKHELNNVFTLANQLKLSMKSFSDEEKAKVQLSLHDKVAVILPLLRRVRIVATNTVNQVNFDEDTYQFLETFLKQAQEYTERNKAKLEQKHRTNVSGEVKDKLAKLATQVKQFTARLETSESGFAKNQVKRKEYDKLYHKVLGLGFQPEDLIEKREDYINSVITCKESLRDAASELSRLKSSYEYLLQHGKYTDQIQTLLNNVQRRIDTLKQNILNTNQGLESLMTNTKHYYSTIQNTYPLWDIIQEIDKQIQSRNWGIFATTKTDKNESLQELKKALIEATVNNTSNSVAEVIEAWKKKDGHLKTISQKRELRIPEFLKSKPAKPQRKTIELSINARVPQIQKAAKVTEDSGTLKFIKDLERTYGSNVLVPNAKKPSFR